MAHGTISEDGYDNYYEQEARAITQCCKNYMDKTELGLVCRTCGELIYPNEKTNWKAGF